MAVLQEACALPCFRCNPFAERIIKLVSPHEDGRLCFEDLLTVMGSVFRPGVPTTAKHVYAFALWDFDGELFVFPKPVQQLRPAPPAPLVHSWGDVQVTIS